MMIRRVSPQQRADEGQQRDTIDSLAAPAPEYEVPQRIA